MKSLSMTSTHQKEYITGFALLLAGPLFILGTHPEQLPLPMLLTPYIMGFLVLFVLGRSMFRVTGMFENLSMYKQNLLIGIFASLPILLLVLQSLHQLTSRDVALVVALGLGMTFYLFRADFLK